MARRGRIKKYKSKRLFSRTASGYHRKNVHSQPMRGGIRL